MTLTVLLLILFAAIIHAWWNTWLKISGDRLAALATIAAGWGGFAILITPFVAFPDPAAWPFLAASVIVHTLYALVLIRAYRDADLSVAYPISRGTGPAIVAFVSVAFLGDVLGMTGFVAVALIVAGIGWLGFAAGTGNHSGLLWSLATGVLIGVYTLLDGSGARAGRSPHGYAVWLFLLTALPIPVIATAVHGRALLALARPLWLKGFAAGLFSALAYWIIIWGMSVAPMGLVAAVRESSVLFAAWFSGSLLAERVRWGPVILVFSGIVLARFAGSPGY